MSFKFKDNSYLQLCWSSCCSSPEQNHLGNLSRGHYEEQLCEIYFEFEPVVQMSFKIFLIYRNICVKLF